MTEQDDLQAFLDDEVNSVRTDIGGPVGVVEVVDESIVACGADWGGWHWQAEGGDRFTAWRRLSDRLYRLSPFDGFDTDWGDPGYKTGDLDEQIPADTRTAMEKWDAFRGRSTEERWAFNRSLTRPGTLRSAGHRAAER